MPETRLFAVAGNPVLHSLSPVIFRRLFRAAGMRRGSIFGWPRKTAARC